MKKIGIPLCEDFVFKVGMGSMIGLAMVAIGIAQYLSFSLEPFGYVLGIILFGFQYAFVMILFMALDKDEWIDKMIPFKLTGRCSR